MGVLQAFLLYAVLPYTGLTLLFFALAAFLPQRGAPARLCRFAARCLAYLGGLIICATYGATASACLKLVGKGGLGQWTTAKSFKWLMWPFIQVWIDIPEESLQRLQTRPAVFVGNHQTCVRPLWCVRS
jgi:lysophosphatidate acyltransferase